MSIQALSWAFDVAATSSPTEKLVLLSIADHADPAGRRAYPSIATIARRTALSERSVQRALRSLEEAGLLAIEHGRGSRGQHVFRLLMSCAKPAENAAGTATEGCHGVTGGVTGCHPGGDTVSPDPSLIRPGSEDQRRARGALIPQLVENGRGLLKCAHDVLNQVDAGLVPAASAEEAVKSLAAQRGYLYSNGRAATALKSANIVRQLGAFARSQRGARG